MKKRVDGIHMGLLREETDQVLARESNRFKLIQAIMLCATTVLPYFMLDTLYYLVIVPRLAGLPTPLAFGALFLYGCTIAAFTILFALPLWVGLLRMAQGMEAGEEVILTDLFSVFSSREQYSSAFTLSAQFGWKVALLWGVERGLWLIVELVPENWKPIAVAIVPVMIGVGVLWFFLCRRDFFYPYFVLAENEDETDARMRPYAVSVASHFWKGFFGWMLLSLISFFVLLMLDVLPRMLISYFRVCRKLNETTQLEDTNHE